MFSLAKQFRPCIQHLKSVIRQAPPKTLQPLFFKTHHIRSFSSQTENKSEDEHIKELKEMLKDDPQLETLLKELESCDSKTKEVNSNSKENESTVDVDKEMLRYNIEEFYSSDVGSFSEQEVELPEQQLPISSDRGQHGVFDIEELVELLRIEGLKDICVITVPASMAYVDYLVLATGRSFRHLRAVAQYTKWAYKQKRSSKDPKSCEIEGLQSNDWLALDMGNIALHLMLWETRETYDIETLWTVGPKYDEKLAEETDPFADLFASEEEKSVEKNNNENVLTLSQNVDYIIEEEATSFVEKKFNRGENEGMESINDWHNVKKKKKVLSETINV